MDLSGEFMRVCPWGHHRRFEMKKNVFLSKNMEKQCVEKQPHSLEEYGFAAVPL